MKNLTLSKELSASLGFQPEGEEKLLFSAFDVERNRVFFASSMSVLYSIPLSVSQNAKLWRKDLLHPEDDSVCLESGNKITALDYLMEKEAVIVGTAIGYLVLHTVDWNSTEVVGRVEGGIRGISCSPDGALLAVMAGLGQCLVMTHDWEVLYEVSLDLQLIHDSIIENTDESSGFQFSSIISWRGDGKYFATLTGPCEPYSLKKLQIWERDSGHLHATTESTAFIGECLAWMPSGAKVVAAHGSDTEYGTTIVLYEKNGLQRSYFSLDAETGTVVGALKWNCSSDLLAASIKCDGYDAIQIWSFSNYHWYMKQEIRYAAVDQVNFDWDPTKPLHLVCWTVNGKVTFYSFVWDTAVTETSNALVVDGYRILVSPLNVSLLPPPMYLFELKFPNVVNEIAYFCKNYNSYLAVCLSDGTLCIIELPGNNLWEQFEEKQIVVETIHSQPLGMRHLTWLDSHILVGVSYCGFNQPTTCSSSIADIGNAGEEVTRWSSICCLLEIELECSENSIPQSVTCSGWHVKDSKKLSMKGLVVGIAPNPAKKCSMFVQLDGGNVLEYSSGLNSLRCSEDLHLQDLSLKYNFSSTCPWMKSVLVCDNDILQPLIFGLDGKGRLQTGRRTLCGSCNSFSFYSDTTGIGQKVVTHLIFTTKQDLLFIVDMDEILHGNPEMRIESYSNGSTLTRKGESKDVVSVWERGATLIGVIHGDEAGIILQALRGNLECIYPRKLVILAVANALVQRRFKDAMFLVRRHRIDFNIIVDYYGLQAFLKSAEEFVSQVSNLCHITEFVCAIKNENVVETLYKGFVSIPSLNGKMRINTVDFNNVVQNKVSSVLSAIRKALEDVITESPARELCILTTLARSEPPALEEALMRIKVMRELELSGHDDTWRNTQPSAEEALKHLLWLTNAESVYDIALGLYDLNLAAIVALNSDKDPKEFLPLLQKLEQMSPNIMQYTIDLRLHRYENALRHIASAGDEYFGDSMVLMKNDPSLFPLGLQLFTTQAAKRDEILEAWGDHLFKENHFEDAAMTYLCCSSFQKAMKAHRACGDWRGVLTVSGLLKLSKDEMLQVAVDLCDELQTLGRPAEAAKIALEYCLDVPGGVEYYVIAREWLEALRICYLHRREDLKIKVRNAALECTNTLIHEYEEGLEKVGKYVTRYLAVRQRRLLLAAKLQSEERPTSDIDEDTLSETSSTLTGMSAYATSSVKGSITSILSSKASKSRERRRQRNRGKIRAGSPGEESALVEHLKGMSLTDSARRELASLLHALIMLGMEEIARHLQRAADKFHLTQVAAVKLAEDASATEKIDETTQTMDHYTKKLREEDLSRCTPSPQTRLLLSG